MDGFLAGRSPLPLEKVAVEVLACCYAICILLKLSPTALCERTKQYLHFLSPYFPSLLYSFTRTVGCSKVDFTHVVLIRSVMKSIMKWCRLCLNFYIFSGQTFLLGTGCGCFQPRLSCAVALVTVADIMLQTDHALCVQWVLSCILPSNELPCGFWGWWCSHQKYLSFPAFMLLRKKGRKGKFFLCLPL